MAKRSKSPSKALTEFFGANLPADVKRMSEALGMLGAAAQARLGKPLLKLTKAGGWVVGAENEPVPTGAQAAVNVASFQAGYIAWHQSAIEGERMASLFGAPVDPSSLPEVKAKNGWEPQLSVEMRLLEDEIDVLYKGTSLGLREALTKLAADVSQGWAENPLRVYPVVELRTENYKHREYGTVYKPYLPIVGWLDRDGKPVKEAKRAAR